MVRPTRPRPASHSPTNVPEPIVGRGSIEAACRRKVAHGGAAMKTMKMPLVLAAVAVLARCGDAAPEDLENAVPRT